jgi:general secretion pathway protein I
MTQQRGFTLLEVLVAIAILGLGLTMILSSQVGLFTSASRGEHLTVATNLARCKMSELELELVREGYPLIDQSDEGPCCGDEEQPGYRCSTKVERITLPDPSTMSSDAGTEEGADPLGPFAALAELGSGQASGSGSPSATGASSLQDMAQTIGSSASASGLGPMVMGFVYPEIKPLLEASIRRVTVTVSWKEGARERDLSVTQFVTDPQQGGLDADAGPGFGEGGLSIPGLPGFGGQ